MHLHFQEKMTEDPTKAETQPAEDSLQSPIHPMRSLSSVSSLSPDLGKGCSTSHLNEKVDEQEEVIEEIVEEEEEEEDMEDDPEVFVSVPEMISFQDNEAIQILSDDEPDFAESQPQPEETPCETPPASQGLHGDVDTTMFAPGNLGESKDKDQVETPCPDNKKEEEVRIHEEVQEEMKSDDDVKVTTTKGTFKARSFVCWLLVGSYITLKCVGSLSIHL